MKAYLLSAALGLLGLSGISMPEWVEWLLFAGLLILTMLTFRRRLYERMRRQDAPVDERITTGDLVTVPSRLEPGQTCRVDYRGSSWSARNAGGNTIEAGTEARISRVDGLTLHLN